MRADIPAEIMFIVAILLTIFSLVIFGLIIKRLLVLIQGKGIWILPIIASLCLIILAVVHIYRMLFYFPLLGTAGPADLFELIVGSLSLARIESFLLLGSGIFAIIGGILYYSASSK
ncbi:hypothetical protein JXB22_00295 [candidate division WOR-3 bacterium]|nr:hypothetical protein [candidate division WOR-3 bacterium]